VAIASGDSQVAVGFPDAVYFYNIKTIEISEVKLPRSKTPPKDQVIAFSPDLDSAALGVARRAENRAYVAVFEGHSRTPLKAFNTPSVSR
jgi:hypothetical protein